MKNEDEKLAKFEIVDLERKRIDLNDWFLKDKVFLIRNTSLMVNEELTSFAFLLVESHGSV